MATEKRLIDANALMKSIRSFRWIGPPNTLKLMFEYLWLIIRDEPTVDAVEVKHAIMEMDLVKVVRCEECKYRVLDTVNGEDWCNHTLGLCGEVYATDFCCHGERKDNG